MRLILEAFGRQLDITWLKTTEEAARPALTASGGGQFEMAYPDTEADVRMGFHVAPRSTTNPQQ